MSVKGPRLTIGIRLVVVRVEDLNLVSALEVDTTVSSPLPFPLHLGRRGPFDVQLNVSKLFLRTNPSVCCDHHGAVLDPPGCRPALFTLPCRKILSVKQYDGIRRR